MFNLETAIVDWHRQMLAAGIAAPVPLEELESHLREEIERLEQHGLHGQAAFETATMKIGTPFSLKKEFKKVESKLMKKILLIGGIVAIMVGMAFVMPAVAQYNHTGAMVLESKCLLALGTALTLGGLIAGVMALKKRTA